MNQLKLYTYIIGSLITLNIAVLAFFLLSKPSRPHKPPIENNRAEVIEMLRLNGEQEVHFNNLADEHKREIQKFKKLQADILSPYFLNVVDSESSIDKDSLVYHKYLESEKAKIELTYKHFQEIKKLLDQEQLPHFQSFMKKTVDRVLLGDKKGRR